MRPLQDPRRPAGGPDRQEACWSASTSTCRWTARKVTDDTRLRAMLPTVLELSDRGAIVLLLSHFGRPKGEVRPDMSTAQLVLPLHRLTGRSVRFIEDCQGPEAERAITTMLPGNIGVLENTRFHLGEEKNDPELAKAMAALGDYYVNDAFSAAHRAHASTEGITHFLPSFAGRAMEAELKALERALGNPERPVAAVVGGAKVSTKLAVLGHLVGKVDHLIIGGGMANTFLAARGVNVGKSLCEHELTGEANAIFDRAEAGRLHDPSALRRGGGEGIRAQPAERAHLQRPRGRGRRDDPRRRPGRGRGAGRRAQDLPHPGVERAARRVRNAAVRRGDGCAGQDRGGADQGRLAGVGRGRRRYRRRAQPRRRRRRISASSRPRAERFSNGWKGVRCRASPPSNSSRWKHEPVGNDARRSSRATASSPRSTSRAGPRPRRSRAMASRSDAWSNDEEMFGLIHQMRIADHHLALLRQRQGDRRDPVRADDGRHGRRQADAAGADRPGRRAVHQDRQGPGGRRERRPDDEADARARRRCSSGRRRSACSGPRSAR